MLRDGLYSAYTWRVRHFREGDPNETTVRFTPDGKPYGFVERLKEDAPGAALERRGGAAARRSGRAREVAGRSRHVRARRAGTGAAARRPRRSHLHVRAAHAHAERRALPAAARRVGRSPDGGHLLRADPEAFTRRYQNMRSANEAIGIGSVVGMVLLYVVGGIGVGLFYMLRGRWVLWRRAAMWGTAVGLAQALAAANEWPLMWMSYDTALPRTTFMAQQIASLVAMFVGFSVFFALSFMAAETLTRRAFGSHPQFWRVWEKGPGSSTAVLGRTAAGYLLVTVFFAYDVLLYLYRDARARLVGAVRGAAPSRRARDLPAVAVGDRELVPGGILGRVPVPRRADRGRGAHRRSVRPAAAVHRDRVRRAGGRLRRRARAVPDAAVLRAAGRAHHPVDRLRPALPVFRPASGHRAALHVRRRLVRAADLHRAGARHLDSEGHGRRDDARAAVDRVVAARAGGALDAAAARGSQRRVDARRAGANRAAAPGDRAPGDSGRGCAPRGSRSAPSVSSPASAALALRERPGSLPISRGEAEAIARRALAERGVTLTPRGACCRCPTAAREVRTSSSPKRPATIAARRCSACTSRRRDGSSAW